MPNTYFQFKQFTIHQERAALKVSTDSCLFGAWVGREFKRDKKGIARALDIGAGTGLLMLMLAQQCNILIDGIEIDTPSYHQAKENTAASPWSSRLQLYLGDVKEFTFNTKYDLIISNPPFYENDMKSNAGNRNIAMHDKGLKLEELLHKVVHHLSNDGYCAFLLPYHRTDAIIAMAQQLKLYLWKRTDIRQTTSHSFFRSMLLFTRNETVIEVNAMAIKDSDNNYTDAFSELLTDFYLYL